MSLTVSMPTWRTPELPRAVESVLSQTFEDLTLVVVADGEPVDLDVDDPRLVMFDLDTNRGRYWCDAVTLAACDTEWWSPHDSDDWSEPDRFETLLATDADAAFSHVVFHRMDGTERRSKVHLDKVGKLATIAKYPAGAYRTEVAQSVGIHPELRGSFDTAFVSLLFRRFDVAVVDEYLYHVHKREGSLTTSADTHLGSEWRREQRSWRRRLFYEAKRDGGSLAPEMSDEFASDVARLRGRLG